MKFKLKYGKVLLGLIAIAGLQSCQVTNRYKSPELDTKNLYREMNPSDSTTIADIPWSEYFKDTQLQGYIAEALNNNYDMLMAEQRIKQAEAALGMARAAYFPELALSAQVNQTRLSSADPLTGMPQDRNSLAYHSEKYSLGLVASWELDIWGKLNRQSRAKYADMLNSYAGRTLIQTSLISSVANSYYSLLALDEQLKVTKEMITFMEESLVTMEAMKEGGMVTAAAVEQSRASLHNVRTTVPDLESAIYQLENALSVMLGRDAGHIERSTIAAQYIPTSLASGVPVQMLSRRPDVQQAELTFRAAFELKNAAQASFYPAITLSSGMIGYATTNTLSQFFKPENLIANLVGGLTQPIFARKKLVTQLKVAKAEQKATLYAFEKAVLTAGKEVSDIMNVYENSLKKNADRAIEVDSQRKSMEYTQELLKAGEATYLEVISAQQGLLQAQLNQTNDKLQQLQACTNLYRALGGGIN
ncbi:RND efflux system, outer membrane lipoprotein, NodT family [Bacteroides coprosuis DSM 18011]|uniref:RND efflux system, outer membrane lipoprotein, NodT family n=1 Tax=Bacteroides coprosuis DSM 18011 TaxID=679937 RepID=F3ZU98_9BACE|nr:MULTISPECIES: TolC family protein [Bacteroides]EGJ71343.1 RND efflux system, outer membrane lipoprotein, NodT family [Bacteroides coprosuis DSM 18011]HJD91950.1 TolC family protein [Bacteroides coprosuis]